MKNCESQEPIAQPGNFINILFDNQNECPICLSEYDLVKTVPYMICLNQHSSCEKCLASIYSRKTCPLCLISLINRNEVKKNRLMCCAIEQMITCKGESVINSKKYRYIGEVKNGKRNGKGTLLKSNGDIITGFFQNGSLVGKCEVLTKSGAQFTGEAVDGKLEGVFSTRHGSKISGVFEIETLSGANCKKQYSNGDEYTGHIWRLKADGFGRMKFRNENTFEGYFSNDYIANNRRGIISGSFAVEIDNSRILIDEIDEQIEKDSVSITQQISSQNQDSSFSMPSRLGRGYSSSSSS